MLKFRRLSMNEVVCPLPWSHEDNSEEITYGEIEVANKSLSDVVDACLLNGNYTLGYAIVLNAIESMGITYFYRFCEFAREMNKRGATIIEYLKEFDIISPLIVSKFNREWISSESYECILIVYKKYGNKYKDYKFNNVDEEYRSDLLSCMDLVKDKLYFVKTESHIELTNNFSKEESIQIYKNNVQYISKLIKLTYSVLKSVIQGENGSSCIVCMQYGGMVNEIYSFIPCGHGWCCDKCIILMEKCPICRQNFTDIQNFNILTPGSLLSKNYRLLKSICIFDREGARCVSCLSKINDVNPPKKYVMIPCGHGWYCNKCSSQINCIVCNNKVENEMCVYL
ncbi:uncharacterized protein LOC126894375 isoform X2 [Daktulosphaira vitifoliae]|uniref:uncharacterized protein LOC126894375 isoform X2 n=1 Tax=Daktulosphaira vitifoliae TaxID=58002 RepID=UPI0021A9B706|nr:uncharacterized protein LOC126894375 isoform X2 [Daktulosphaira vitifoliae]XP_050521299.1 uncharacterized protein LOC126894375 isoform X2 [Daktulosphaira vitifoliae]XP_050521300.1 uncharacterized protein LOC126894375 isoform X2 [Daktulosphaira vitifoliae]